jgi:hypothetical protein
MNYESAVRNVTRSATAVSGAHLALIVLEVSVMSSSLPNVYVADTAATCGARFLAGFSAHNIVKSGVCAILALVIALGYRSWISARSLTFTVMRSVGQSFHIATISSLGILSIAFFVFAASQLSILGDPPPVAKDFDKTHVCNLIAQ